MQHTFPTFFFTGALSAAGWPRRVGILRRQVVDGGVAHSVHSELLKRGMAIGAANPPLAVQLITDQFAERDWDAQPAEELFAQLHFAWGSNFNGEPVRVEDLVTTHGHLPPWGAILQRGHPPVSLHEQSMIAWASLQERQFQVLLHWNFAAAMLWGLESPRLASKALCDHANAMNEGIREAVKSGLQLPAGYCAPSGTAYAEESEEFVRAFENRVRHLLAIPDEFGLIPEVLQLLSRPRGLQVT